MSDIILDTFLDTLKLIPFLFLVYLFIEFLENKAEGDFLGRIKKAGKFGPFLGGILGVIPQCGFSAALSNLYAGGIVTKGTLIAVFLSSSDEMLPMLISENVNIAFISKILLIKMAVGILCGFSVDYFLKKRNVKRNVEIHELCEREGCHCEEGIVKSALRHTLNIFLFILIVSFVLNIAVAFSNIESISNIILKRAFIGESITALIGLIPNCASSVIITKLYLDGLLSMGALLSGLLVNSGVGILVLFRVNKDTKDNLSILLILYVAGVVFGSLLGLIV